MLLHGDGALVYQQHLWEMRLYGRFVADYGDLGECPVQLVSGCLSGVADLGMSTRWTSQTQTRLVPEPDAGFVQIQSQDRTSRWHLTHQEVRPLPHGGRLGGAKCYPKRGPFFAPLLLTENSLAAPKRGPPCGPQNASGDGTTPVAFWAHPARILACIIASGRRSLAGRPPSVEFQRRRNRYIHFFAAAPRAGRHEAASFGPPL